MQKNANGTLFSKDFYTTVYKFLGKRMLFRRKSKETI